MLYYSKIPNLLSLKFFVDSLIPYKIGGKNKLGWKKFWGKKKGKKNWGWKNSWGWKKIGRENNLLLKKFGGWKIIGGEKKLGVIKNVRTNEKNYSAQMAIKGICK